jgi:hypothetical protein
LPSRIHLDDIGKVSKIESRATRRQAVRQRPWKAHAGGRAAT